MIRTGSRDCLKVRMRQSLPAIVTLIFGAAVLLVWAGIIESFFSQYHAPVLPYSLKIAFGILQLALLVVLLGVCGRGKRPAEEDR